MIIEIALCVAAVALSVIAIVLVSLVTQIKAVLAGLQSLLVRINAELPSSIGEVRAAVARLNVLVMRAQAGVAYAVVLLHMAGRLGEALQRVQRTVQRKGRSVWARLAGVVSGARAVTNVLKQRLHHEGGASNGT